MRLFSYSVLIWLFFGFSESLIFGKRRRRRSPPINCVVTGFSAWTPCTVSCGTGTSSRSRSVTRHPANGGAACPHLVENTKCNTQLCPVDCQVSEFSAQSPCSVSCGKGTTKRSRSITRYPAHGGKACPHLSETNECNVQPCPVDCEVSDFSESLSCSVSCGEGTTTRSRTVLQDPAHGGTSCPHLTEEIKCNTQPCPIDCEVSEFSEQSPCSVSCGKGTTTRSRSITRQPAHGGVNCPHLTDTDECNAPPCPIDCEVTSWSSRSPCDVTCGEGRNSRVRQIVTRPRYNGKDCPSLEEISKCENLPECPNYLQKMILLARTREGLGVIAVVLLILAFIIRKCCGKKQPKKKFKMQ